MKSKNQILFYIDPALKTDLKIICAKEQTTLTDLLTKLIKVYVKEYNKESDI